MPSFLARSPIDLRILIGLIEQTKVEPIVELSSHAFSSWAQTTYDHRYALLMKVEAEIRNDAETLAQAITLEIGKTINEARLEIGMVLDVFKQTLEDAEEYHFNEPRKVGSLEDNAEIRHSPRGPVAVISAFNFPILTPIRSIVPYLLAGNTVILKPSPMGAHIGSMLADFFIKHLPEGVFTIVQGGSDERQELCKDERVRSISFSGNLIAAREVVNAVALDFSKNLALETGGKNAVILLEDGDVSEAAKAAAEGMCSMTGQRNDSTSRAIVHSSRVDAFCAALLDALKRYVPGDPRKEMSELGVVVNESAHKRYADVLDSHAGTWILRGDAMYHHEGRPGYYVRPSARLWANFEAGISCPITNNEIYAPIIDIFSAKDDIEIIALNNSTTYGNTASVFTQSRERFEAIGRELRVGNIFANMPTTAARPWLPSCGRRNSNNGKPFGRGFIRFAANELSVQMRGLK